jgi:hypothetical protein
MISWMHFAFVEGNAGLRHPPAKSPLHGAMNANVVSEL